jgi:hypothetical protein
VLPTELAALDRAAVDTLLACYGRSWQGDHLSR